MSEVWSPLVLYFNFLYNNAGLTSVINTLKMHLTEMRMGLCPSLNFMIQSGFALQTRYHFFLLKVNTPQEEVRNQRNHPLYGLYLGALEGHS